MISTIFKELWFLKKGHNLPDFEILKMKNHQIFTIVLNR
jgi:hypothetical protein